MAYDFAGYAATYDIVFHRPIPAEQVRFKVQRMVDGIFMDCMSRGARMMGHVKCLIDAQDSGYLICSVTSLGEQARCMDKLTAPFMRMQLTMNIMLYGLDEMIIEEIVIKNARMQFHDATQIVIACLGQPNPSPVKELRPDHQKVDILGGQMRRIMDSSLHHL